MLDILLAIIITLALFCLGLILFFVDRHLVTKETKESKDKTTPDKPYKYDLFKK
jgi:hypothetical protein